ncbi:ImuA family protein [Agrobacterium vitis]|uniref:ImuA family protein n=1 Tax=Agrobacterium vitis TaxID=373 RepID=UPI001572E48D|nr:ImuA family protein [Agrobacterium vitis]NSZ15626.1 damage-inducible protein [Agrobacterium vitis]QZO04449.1 ImuA family protein [Agrobacterium vitis]UJL86591.1 damage-inducible protein [Agrobacterium vitis]
MNTPVVSPVVTQLRARIDQLEGGPARRRDVLPFGVAEIDAVLPGGGLAMGALHEVVGGGNGTVDGAVAALFTAGLAARAKGKILWCITQQDLFAPSLAQAGLAPGRVIYVEAGNEADALACAEEGLRHGGLGAIVCEVAKLSMIASRRLQLAAERTGTLALVIRRWRRQAEASNFGQPTAAVTRWRISALPSSPLPVPGVGRARWRVELIRCRTGSADIEVEACDAKGCLAIPADLADRSAAADIRRHNRAS